MKKIKALKTFTWLNGQYVAGLEYSMLPCDTAILVEKGYIEYVDPLKIATGRMSIDWQPPRLTLTAGPRFEGDETRSLILSVHDARDLRLVIDNILSLAGIE